MTTEKKPQAQKGGTPKEAGGNAAPLSREQVLQQYAETGYE
ncbi:MAG: MarR family transcriptional regulator, partial [Mesorhizobium sp.]